jgi:hypothetical protein
VKRSSTGGKEATLSSGTCLWGALEKYQYPPARPPKKSRTSTTIIDNFFVFTLYPFLI